MKHKYELTEENIIELADDIMLELNEEEIEDIASTNDLMKQKFSKVFDIQTIGVSAMHYPLEQPHTFLREDEPARNIDQKFVLDNAPQVSGDFVVIEKVVK
ncbi:hypothetical protein [Williamsoniiplasma lucivorax]|uniref:Aspartyl/glutamyl-tRNA amidotransferase subunit C n=1 Tax=Williamsoniiplasma lucivorax TaxID=209274 RepID=A0A2S5RA03_9MOLU|nr:hypothetical protein [Williamsoniiplasma lucivorax]PPE04159.1 aspartyl/glutamyl-tRNA amidotransferase subunit C [Williamsoniiplasma lucivorax]